MTPVEVDESIQRFNQAMHGLYRRALHVLGQTPRGHLCSDKPYQSMKVVASQAWHQLPAHIRAAIQDPCAKEPS